MKRLLSSVSLLALFAGSPAHAAMPVETRAGGNTAFAFELYQQLRAAEGNLFLSPYSISTALAMTWAGARGETERQMAAVLHFGAGQEATHRGFEAVQSSLRGAQGDGVTLEVANALWPQRGAPLLPAFQETVRAHYGVSITPLDYVSASETARQTINKWVEDQTHDKIRDIIAPGVLNALTRLVLVNAIYFKGSWLKPFTTFATHDAKFHAAPGRDVPVRMMSQKETFPYAELDGLQLVELPYAGEGLAMLLALPAAVDGLAALEQGLSPDLLQAWRARLAPRQVVVQLPRFKLTAQFRLDQPLTALGMGDAFREGVADFSGMDGRPNWLYIGAVLHKAFVEVNEEGTEAAAATAVIMPARALPRPDPVFRADHPFVFLILDRASGSVLFMGRLADPGA